jgi:hypothetical protein
LAASLVHQLDQYELQLHAQWPSTYSSDSATTGVAETVYDISGGATAGGATDAGSSPTAGGSAVTTDDGAGGGVAASGGQTNLSGSTPSTPSTGTLSIDQLMAQADAVLGVSTAGTATSVGASMGLSLGTSGVGIVSGSAMIDSLIQKLTSETRAAVE